MKLTRALERLENQKTFTNKAVWADETYLYAGSPGRSYTQGTNDLRCILTAYDGETVKGKYVSTGRWSMSVNDAQPVLSTLKEHNVLVSDKEGVYDSYCTQNGQPHQAVGSGHGVLDGINKLHTRLKTFFKQFNGVASRYLDQYLAWFAYTDRRPEIKHVKL